MTRPTRRRVGRSRLPIALLACGACLITASCTTGGEEDAPAAEPSAPPTVHTTPSAGARPGPLPLDGHFLSREDHEKLRSALDLLVAACMKRAGVPLPPAPAVAAEPPRHERRYGISTPEQAARYGYHLAERTTPPTPPPVTARQQRALSGTPDGKPGPGGSPPQGCNAAAAERITGTDSFPADALVVRQLNMDSFEQSKNDARVRIVLRKWSDCMKGDGFSYTDPLAAPRSMAAGPRASAREIATARADVACKEKTRLIGVWSAVESAYQNRLIKERAKELTAARREHDDRLRRAAEVLRSFAPSS
ncbi:hypothetical protein [Streptomyces netropsis]|uniref:Lipoprotein n=1 Tax=Streptomyces netropsis TaxID=55404 RepID=A0A7W7LF86_STRNE|nr:hypothetical protein [Streptomyces netropsis]MBB4888847.1 hypothetical protein [Streptomyces netropsis]GGR11798.1 hypothetical protein GCM10010219_16380 [Streptomyces netropsis]